MTAVIASIIVSAIAATATWLAARANAKAAMRNASTSSRVVLEEEAYQRARAYDVQTIERQDREIKELRQNQEQINLRVKESNAENESLHEENRLILEDNARLRAELAQVRGRVVRLERGIHPDTTERIRERETDTNPMMREILRDGRE